MRRAFPLRFLVLALVALAAADVTMAAWTVGAWNRVARAAMPRNQALAEALARRERARCWPVSTDDPSLQACDVGESFDEHLVRFSDPDVPTVELTAAADRALRCRCVGVSSDSGRLARISSLMGRGTDVEHATWRERQLVLMATLATATELGVLAETIEDAAAATAATRDGALASHLRGVISRVTALVHTNRAKTRRLVMSVSVDAMSTARYELGAVDLRSHDRAARAFEVSRALDACTDSESCTAIGRADVLSELDRVSLREVLDLFDQRVRECDAMLARWP